MVLSMNKELDLKILNIKNQFLEKIKLNKEILHNLKSNYLDFKFLKSWLPVSLLFYEVNFLLFNFILINFKNNSKSLLVLYFCKFLNKKMQNQVNLLSFRNKF